MEITKYIKDLLYFHDCVMIPGFGGFIANYKPSEVQKYKHVIYPPSKTVLFNRQLQSNDGLLINHVAHQESCDYPTAAEKVRQFARQCEDIVENKGVILFPDVGKLYVNANNSLIFLPELRKNFLQDTFGLKPVSFDPAHYGRQPEQQNATQPTKTKPEGPIHETPEPEPARTTPKPRWEVIGLAASIIFILLFSQFIIWGYSPEKLSLNNLGLLDLTDQTPSVEDHYQLMKTELPVLEISAKKEIYTLREHGTGSEINRTTSTQPTGGYYIIFGSFQSFSNANKLKQKLEAGGNQARIFDTQKGYYRVGLYATNNKREALNTLKHYQNTEKSSLWMVYSPS